PPVAERLAQLADHLGVITAMLGPGKATYEGRFAQVRDAINVPKGRQAHIPVIVGGNGRDKTAGLAVRFADELNFVFLSAAEVRERIAEVRGKCEAAGRDPDTLRFSLYGRDEAVRHTGQARVDYLGEMATAGLDRLVCFPGRWDTTRDGQTAFAEDCRVAGIRIGG
ncbi:MAG TPA: LLM class flavin-dependent oxidoreductase, partial [Candidatus Limnocylindrales bacterium]